METVGRCVEGACPGRWWVSLPRGGSVKEEDVKVRSLGFILRVEECQDSISVSERSLWIDGRSSSSM